MRDRFGRCVALLLSLGLILAGALAANAQGNTQAYQSALAKFAGDSYNDTDEGIAGVATSGNPLAERVILALQNGRLLFNPDDKTIYIQQEAGPILDAATGKPIAGAAPVGLKPVRINNRVRRSIDAALGGLTLLSPTGEAFRGGPGVFK
jgi:urea transport system permease protein